MCLYSHGGWSAANVGTGRTVIERSGFVAVIGDADRTTTIEHLLSGNVFPESSVRQGARNGTTYSVRRELDG